MAPVRRSSGLRLGEVGEQAADALDWLVVMRRFDEDGLFDRMAGRGALTAELMAALAMRIAAFHDAAAPVSGFSGPRRLSLACGGNPTFGSFANRTGD